MCRHRKLCVSRLGNRSARCTFLCLSIFSAASHIPARKTILARKRNSNLVKCSKELVAFVRGCLFLRARSVARGHTFDPRRLNCMLLSHSSVLPACLPASQSFTCWLRKGRTDVPSIGCVQTDNERFPNCHRSFHPPYNRMRGSVDRAAHTHTHNRFSNGLCSKFQHETHAKWLTEFHYSKTASNLTNISKLHLLVSIQSK